MSEALIPVLEDVLSRMTEGEWFACTWDPMERPHVSLSQYDHHPNRDVAQLKTNTDAVGIAMLRNSGTAFVGLARAVEAYLADPDVLADHLECADVCSLTPLREALKALYA